VILLTSTSDALQAVTGSTQTIHVQASYVDLTTATSAITPKRTNTIITTATTTSIVGAPASGDVRTVKFVSIQNTGASAETVTVQHTDGTNVVKLQSLSLSPGYTLVYNEGSGWTLYDSTGNIQTAIGPGRFLKRTVILNGTTTFTTQPGTNSIVARLLGAGGQGGGCAATIGCCGSGGGSGAYAEWNVAVSPSTAYTCAVGAGGSTGGAGANGQNGGNTTLTIGATTCTANGGGGGVNGASISVPVLGGAPGAIATNGTVNCPGTPGEGCIATGTAANNRSGAGGGCLFGGGANAVLEATNTAGTAATGFGAGGSGAATSAATARAGGNGANGVLIIDEYS
jgi:hypothetical protein